MPEPFKPVTFRLQGRVPVVAVMEHFRTIRGRKNPITGAAETEQINLGWFIHLGFEGGTYAFHFGSEKPNLEVGDEMNVALWR